MAEINEATIKAELEKHHWLSGDCSCGNNTHWTLNAHHAWVVWEFIKENTREEWSLPEGGGATRRVTEWE